MNDVTVVAPKSAVFECDISAGEPAGKIRWFRDGREIFAGSKYAMTYKRSSAQLTIYETEVDDKGVYKCEAANKLGSVNSTARLIVQCKQPCARPDRGTPGAQSCTSQCSATSDSAVPLYCDDRLFHF